MPTTSEMLVSTTPYLRERKAQEQAQMLGRLHTYSALCADEHHFLMEPSKSGTRLRSFDFDHVRR